MARGTVPPSVGEHDLLGRGRSTTWAMSHPGSLGIIVLGALVVLCGGVRFASPVLVPMILGAYVAIVSTPLVTALRRRGVPAPVAITAALFVDTAVLVGLVGLLASSVAQLSERLPRYEGLLQGAEWRVTVWLRRFFPQVTLPDVIDPGAVMAFVASLLGEIAGFLWNVLVALMIAAFLLTQLVRKKPGSEGALHLSEGWRRAIREVNRYIAIKTAMSMATGVLIGAWTWVCGTELPILYGLLAFLLNYIPNVGSIIAAVPAIGLALLEHGVGPAALIASGYLAINVVIGNVIEPRVMGRALGLTPLVVMLSVIFWGWLLGAVGALLSALLTLFVKLVLLSTEDLRTIAIALGPSATKPDLTEQTPGDLIDETMPQTLPPPAVDGRSQ